jgi:flagella basal body P-ring formation protein FlgA
MIRTLFKKAAIGALLLAAATAVAAPAHADEAAARLSPFRSAASAPPQEITRAETRAAASAAPAASGAPVVRKGEQVLLVYVAPGLKLTTRAKALDDAAAGDTIRLINPESKRTVEGTITGPGAAEARPDIAPSVVATRSASAS